MLNIIGTILLAGFIVFFALGSVWLAYTKDKHKRSDKP